ncbi:MAG: tRNA uridine-5-carboxymethylaminomethyl(34) synthesis GTPase MnmE [Puniceicoccales bacterium]|jgi:tRNA modification GTPase|nr:tRNA uridine-5-carboxymethylaminomethyl(34) synthesis GTPase MnmE [Puniceicoccales bacterium]
MGVQEDTIVALSTPWGESGIGVIRLSGPNCLHLTKSIFRRSVITPRRNYVGSYQTLEGFLLDDVTFVYFAPHASFTGEATLEISCHGNPLILRQVIRDCIRRGCRQADPGEFTRRAFTNGVLDLSQAEAVADLIHAKSQQALVMARNQLLGSLSKQINRWGAILMEQIAWIEAYLDFPEEDLPEANRHAYCDTLHVLSEEIDQLVHTHAHYQSLQNGIATVIVGAPNVGKSTLLNTLLGHDRAIVSPMPGTTRDFITEYIQLESYGLRLVDTAGIHTSCDSLEHEGIQRSLEQLEKANLILWVLDQSQPMPHFEQSFIQLLDSSKTLALLNKADLPCTDVDFSSYLKQYLHCSISLKEDVGAFNKVQNFIKDFLDQRYRDFSQVAFMVNERHTESLMGAQSAIKKAIHLLQTQGFEDCLAAELKTALRAMEQIVGRVDYEQILDQIFSRFCIGK